MTTGIVLAGAAALGAYEAGVLHHVLDRVARDVGRPRIFDIVSGTSAGAINAAAIAAFADRPVWGAARICDTWAALRLGQVLRPSAIELLRSAGEATEMSSSVVRALRIRRAHGGLLDPRPLASLLGAVLPIERIAQHIASGILHGIAISATHVASGRATVFHQAARPMSSRRGDQVITVATKLTIAHAMASAAIPLLLPPVWIAGDLYCDGGLRQMVPLSPSIHLGARRLLVINPLTPASSAIDEQARRAVSTSPFYLAGKALNALFADRTEVDLARLEQLSHVLRAGTRHFGPAFEAGINAELARTGLAPLHDISVLRIGPSRDLGQMAAEYAAGPELTRREHGLGVRAMRCLANAATRTGDLLAYLLFDGGFASELIALGRRDARARHEELCAFFGRSPQQIAELA